MSPNLKSFNRPHVFLMGVAFFAMCSCQIAAQQSAQNVLSPYSVSQLENMLQTRNLAQSQGVYFTLNRDAIKQLDAELQRRTKPLEIDSVDLWAIVKDKDRNNEQRSDAARSLLTREDDRIESFLLSLA